MADGSDAIADWPLLNALVNTASGATWVSIHHGGGVGIGRSIHAGQVSVADGTALAAEKLARVLANDPAMGVLRHVDAGYPEARGGGGGGGPAGTDGGGREPDACPRPIPPIPPAAVAARWPCCNASQQGHHAAIPAATATAAFDRMWADLAGIGRHPGTGGYRRFAWTREDADLREWFAGRGRRPRARRSSTTGPATSGPGGATPTPRRPRASSSARTWTPCPTAAPSTARSASSSALAAVDALRARGFAPARPLGVARVRRRGGRPVRRRLRRVAAAHRRAHRRPGPRADRRRRREHGRGAHPGRAATRARSAATTRRCAGSGRSSSCTSSRAGGSTSWTAPSPSAPGSGRTAAGASSCRARPTTRAPPRSTTGATR